jgi:hypothetical protein
MPVNPLLRRLATHTLTDGDIIGFSGSGIVSDAINIGTYGMPRSGLAHVGIVSHYRGIPYLFESTTLNGDKECAILHKPINGVQAHKLADILQRPGKVWLYKPVTYPTGIARRRLQLALLCQLGTPYDYVGAVRSRGWLLRMLRSVLFRQEITQLFCSELVALVLTEARIAFFPNASSQSPNSLVRRLVKTGVYTKRVRLK